MKSPLALASLLTDGIIHLARASTHTGGPRSGTRAFRPVSSRGLDVLESRLMPSVTLSVTDAPYNANPSGQADATNAIQRCIDDVANAGGGTVLFPNGTYKVSFPASPGTSPAIKLRSNVTLQGNGAANSVVHLDNQQGNYYAIFAPATFWTHLSQVKIDDLGIDGNGPNNPVISASDLSSEPRYAVEVYSGDHISIQRCRFFNILDSNAITLNGVDVTDVTVDSCTFDQVGGNSVDFDHSTIYTNCNNATISNNTFASRYGAGTNGARTAIEIHGNDQVVTNNNISGFRYGINVTGISVLGSDTQLYQNNTLTDVGTGFVIWAYTASPNPVLKNCTIRDNSVTLNVDGWSGFFDGESRQGIAMDASGKGQVDGLDIINNNIAFTNYASTARPNDWYGNGIQFNGSASQPTFKNIRILNNYITHSLGAGIFINWPIDGLDISGNVITDPGSSPKGDTIFNDNHSAIRLEGAMQNVQIYKNSFIDDQTTHSMVYGIWNGTENPGNITYFANQVKVTSGAVVPLLGITVSLTQVDLGSSFNRTGIVSDGTTFSGGLDGGGNALSANLLGTNQTWNGTPFTIGAAGSSDVVSAIGQTISLPAGKYASLKFLATAVNGNQSQQTFSIKYSDGTTATFTQSISDWYTPQNYSGESKAVTMSYRDRGGGTKDSRTFYVYGYSFALDATKTITSITLQNQSNVNLLAIDLVS